MELVAFDHWSARMYELLSCHCKSQGINHHSFCFHFSSQKAPCATRPPRQMIVANCRVQARRLNGGAIILMFYFVILCNKISLCQIIPLVLLHRTIVASFEVQHNRTKIRRIYHEACACDIPPEQIILWFQSKGSTPLHSHMQNSRNLYCNTGRSSLCCPLIHCTDGGAIQYQLNLDRLLLETIRLKTSGKWIRAIASPWHLRWILQ